MLVINIGVPAITIMEARNFISVRELLQNNDWLLTTLNGEARYQKPPLPTWLSAFSGLLFGIDSVTALRLPAVLMVLFSGIFVYLFSLKITSSKENSVQNALVLITSFYIFAIPIEAPWDLYAHGFMFAGIYYLYQVFNSTSKAISKMFGAALFIGLSILSKGPVSVYVMLLPFLLSYFFVFRKQLNSKTIIGLIAILFGAIVIGGWWFVYVRIMDPIAFESIAQEELTNWKSAYIQPFYFYWNFFLETGIWSILAVVSLTYPYMIKRVSNKTTYKFLFWWVLFALLLLSFIPEKKPRYVVPVLFPLAVLIGMYLNFIITKFSTLKNKLELSLIYGNFGIVGFFSCCIPIFIPIFYAEIFNHYTIHYICLTIICLFVGFLSFFNLKNKNIKPIFYGNILLIVSILVFIPPMTSVLNKNQRSNSIQTLHTFEKDHNFTTYTIKEISPEIVWEYNGILKNIYKNSTLIYPTEQQFGLLVKQSDSLLVKHFFEQAYEYQLLETYNLNKGSKTKKRLIQQLYLVSKK